MSHDVLNECYVLSGEYSSSLDKLNSSLSELQGEIMSMSLSGDNSRRSSQVPRGASVPRMAQSDDVLAQGIKDNFLFAAPDKNKRRGDKNAAAAAAERIMTQSAPTDVSASPVQPVSVMTSCSESLMT